MSRKHRLSSSTSRASQLTEESPRPSRATSTVRFIGWSLLIATSAVLLYGFYGSYRVIFASRPADSKDDLPVVILEHSKVAPKGVEIDEAEVLAEAHRIDEELREMVLAKKSLPVDVAGMNEVTQVHRARIADRTKVIEEMTEFPVDSIQWHLRNEIENLKNNQHH